MNTKSVLTLIIILFQIGKANSQIQRQLFVNKCKEQFGSLMKEIKKDLENRRTVSSLVTTSNGDAYLISRGNDTIETYRNLTQKSMDSLSKGIEYSRSYARYKIFQTYFSCFLLNDTLNEKRKEQVDMEMKLFYDFCYSYGIDRLKNLCIKPIYSEGDNFFVKRLNEFQRKHSFIVFDRTGPQKDYLMILLFSPSIKEVGNKPLIFSWKPMFVFGKCLFPDALGNSGYELLLENLENDKQGKE